MNTLVNSDNILEISNLSKVYHTNKSEISAIDNLNLNIKNRNLSGSWENQAAVRQHF